MFLALHRQPRALSYFNRAARRWAAIPLRAPHDPTTPKRPADSPHPADAAIGGKQSLTLLSWNIHASHAMPAARCKLVLDRIFEGRTVPDIVHLQEVAPGARQAVLDDPRVRRGFMTTDAEDCGAFEGRAFATMTCLSRRRFGAPGMGVDEERGAGAGGEGKLALDAVFRMELPSRYARDALCVDIIAAPAAAARGDGGVVLRLVNVHLDSLDAHLQRVLQVRALAALLREPGSRGGVVAGDFNALGTADHELVGRYGLRDAWEALSGSMGLDGATWGVRGEMAGGRRGKRLDKAVMLGSIEPEEIDVLRPGLFRGRPWSDHCGLRCTFTI